MEIGVSSCVPAALLKTLEEDELDLEERIQRCQADARQYLRVKPEIAWSRAQQAVTLLGPLSSPVAVTDEATRDAVHLTLAETCFTLGIRNTRLAPELGRPDPFSEACRAAYSARCYGLAAIINAIGRVHRAGLESRLQMLVELAQVLPKHKSEIEPWLLMELAPKTDTWVQELESALWGSHNAEILLEVLPPLYDVLDYPNRLDRVQRIRQRGIQMLIKDRKFAPALVVLRTLSERQLKLEAICLEGMGDFREAAQCHMAAGNLKEALTCYRSIPDLEEALKLVGEVGEHPATESLRWISRLQRLVAERPEKFTKMVTPAEKKLLEELLEKALGVNRRKAAPRKGIKKAAASRKGIQRKTRHDGNPYF